MYDLIESAEIRRCSQRKKPKNQQMSFNGQRSLGRTTDNRQVKKDTGVLSVLNVTWKFIFRTKGKYKDRY